MIQVVDSGLVYRNPRPELRSRHTWHPTIVRFDDGEWLCTFDIGDADVALDYRTYKSRSSDDGRTWSPPERVFADPPGRPTTHSVRISRISDGPDELVAFGGLMLPRRSRGPHHQRADPRVRRHGPDPAPQPRPRAHLGRPHNGRAAAGGPGLGGLPRDRRAPGRPLGRPHVSTWMGWNGETPNGMKALSLVSHDQGRTWPDVRRRVRPLGREQDPLGAVASSSSRTAGCWPSPGPRQGHGRGRADPLRPEPRRPAVRAPRSDGLPRPDDQARRSCPTVACSPPTAATTSRASGAPRRGSRATTGSTRRPPRSGRAPSRAWRARSPAGEELAALKFGFPQMLVRPDGDVMLVFWVEEDCIKNIRWLRIRSS